MIASPTHFVQEIKHRISASYPHYVVSQHVITNQKSIDVVRTNALTGYYIRMSWLKKLDFFTKLLELIKSIGSISLLLNTLHSVEGKIVSYSKTNPQKVNYDNVLYDHDRMLTSETLDEIMAEDLVWFETLEDKEQVSCVITLMRHSGGAIVYQIYQKLKDLYNRRLLEISASQSSKLKIRTDPEPNRNDKNEKKHCKVSYDPDNEFSKKVVQLIKKWNVTMAMYKSQLETKKKSKTRKEKKSTKSNKTFSLTKSKKTTPRINYSFYLDWIEIMPIWIVKKIFSYVDKKTLLKAKKVNEYWKWAINDFLKDQKMRKILDKNLRECGSNLFEIPEILGERKTRTNWTEKRTLKLTERGAILEKLRHVSKSPLTTDCLTLQTCTVAIGLGKNKAYPFDVDYLEKVDMFERNRNCLPLLYKWPEYFCKDYGIICKNVESSEDYELLSNDDDASGIKMSSSTDLSVDDAL